LKEDKKFNDAKLTELLFGKSQEKRNPVLAVIADFFAGKPGKDKSAYTYELESATQSIPPWVKIGTALALGLGTMIGWKRIVVTVGEKIGKTHLTYAQGASAELVAAFTIRLADVYGLPVSTTHVLSSGVAGTMAANRSGLQMSTLRNLLLAWVLTLPVCVLLGAALFAAAIFIVLNELTYIAFGGLVLLVIAFVIWRFTRSMAKPARKAEKSEPISSH
jgi:phosphate/sulfate permease